MAKVLDKYCAMHKTLTYMLKKNTKITILLL